MEVIVEGPVGGPRVVELADAGAGLFSGFVPGAGAGDRYRYRLDDDRELPDPASRFQPDGVHGPSQVVDPRAFGWHGRAVDRLDMAGLVIYEAHVGTFTPEGTFAGAAARLPELAALGVTALELMPIGDFPGARNWGYDGVALFAPARAYGTPDDLRRLVDGAHALGIGIILDVVYNHLGPDGAYLSAFSPFYFTERHHTPWGRGLNFDGEHSRMVRDFFVENACHWIHEYHMDGLRLDATHAIADDGPRHFLAELTDRVHASAAQAGRRVVVVAEDHRNLKRMLLPERDGGWGLDGVWADDFHHQTRRLLAGDDEGYYRDFSGRTADLAETIRRGWFYTGQRSGHLGEPRGTDPSGVPAERFVICLQNHDQVGNRALGGRLHHEIEPAAYRAASALLLMAPETPLLFMGQEWAASTPFLYFTDHHAELGRLVTEGRREEFRHFAAFSDASVRDRIPDPQAASTFDKSRLRWEERESAPHALALNLYRALIGLRRSEPALLGGSALCRRRPLDEGTLALLRRGPDADILLVVRLAGHGRVTLNDPGWAATWETVLTTEDAAFSRDPSPPEIESGPPLRVRFARPAAVILRGVRAGGAPAPG